MGFIDVIFIIGIFMTLIGLYASYSLLNLSIKKSKEELKDLNVANLWVLFGICLPLGLVLIYFWF